MDRPRQLTFCPFDVSIDQQLTDSVYQGQYQYQLLVIKENYNQYLDIYSKKL